jgi:hypothetical protein
MHLVKHENISFSDKDGPFLHLINVPQRHSGLILQFGIDENLQQEIFNQGNNNVYKMMRSKAAVGTEGPGIVGKFSFAGAPRGTNKHNGTSKCINRCHTHDACWSHAQRDPEPFPKSREQP